MGRLVERKRLGQFYTPTSEAESLAAWAVRSTADAVLEPSVGDGALLLAALRQAALVGQHELSILACDIDPAAIARLRSIVDPSVELLDCDFFDLTPSASHLVDAVLANPPFTRNHQIEPSKRAALKRRYPLKGAAGLWAYFVLHARKFLKPGGRMAFVVPGAATFSNYGADLLRQLRLEFRDLSLQELPSKPEWIGKADERGVVLLADGYQQGPAEIVHRGIWQRSALKLAGQSPGPVSLPSFAKLVGASQPLSSFADLSIGLVTGRNRVFLLNADEVQQAGLEKRDLTPVISRVKHARGARVTRSDLRAAANAGEKTWLLTPDSLGNRNSPVRRRLAKIDAAARKTTCWLNKRSPWWRVDCGAACEAVFTYMNDVGPRLSLVDRGVYCTNTLHRVVFKEAVDDCTQRAIVLSFISTFGQLYAEGLGRGYGGGVLKFELQEARAFPILPTSPLVTEERFEQVDIAIRAGNLALAQSLADEALVEPILGRAWQVSIREMKSLLQSAREARRSGAARLFSTEGL